MNKVYFIIALLSFIICAGCSSNKSKVNDKENETVQLEHDGLLTIKIILSDDFDPNKIKKTLESLPGVDKINILKLDPETTATASSNLHSLKIYYDVQITAIEHLLPEVSKIGKIRGYKHTFGMNK